MEENYILEDFVSDMIDNLKQFKKYWEKNHNVDPDNFPMEMEQDNTGAWFDQFKLFMESRN